MGGKHRYRMAIPCEGIQMYEYRGDADGLFCTAFVTDRELTSARRPWAVVRLRKQTDKKGCIWIPEVLANFRTLHEATDVFEAHAMRNLGLAPERDK